MIFWAMFLIIFAAQFLFLKEQRKLVAKRAINIALIWFLIVGLLSLFSVNVLTGLALYGFSIFGPLLFCRSYEIKDMETGSSND